MTTTRPEGQRYVLALDDDSWWEMGWDRPLSTFYAQRWQPFDRLAEEHEPIVTWHGVTAASLPDVDALEAAMGCDVPDHICCQLEADQAAYPGVVGRHEGAEGTAS